MGRPSKEREENEMFKKKEVKTFENALTEVQKVHYSRYIVSWLKVILRNKDILKRYNRLGIIFGEDFENWLRSENLTEDEIDLVRWMAKTGKLELEVSAFEWIAMI